MGDDFNLSFDVGDILTPEEADELFAGGGQENAGGDGAGKAAPDNGDGGGNAAGENENDNTGADAAGESAQEEVGRTGSDGKAKGSGAPEGGGSSPGVYSSIAKALKDDGVFPDLDDTEIDGLKSPEDFASMFDRIVESRLGERQRRIDEALRSGVAPDTVRQYEQAMQWYGSISDDDISREGDDGDSLRRDLIYRDFLSRGYSDARARREVEKSFSAGSDVDDAKDALASLKDEVKKRYDGLREEARKKADDARAEMKRRAEDVRKSILDSDIEVGGSKLDKRTRQRIYDAIVKPVEKDPETGQMKTAIQKFQDEHPVEFLRQLGMWYVLTDGGKDFSGLVKSQARAEKNSAIRELGRKINSTTLNGDGSLRYMSGKDGGYDDPLLSDTWNIGWGEGK